MSRKLCNRCQRPEKACICAFTSEVENAIKVIVLQHPQEVKQSKGTISLLNNSLTHCEVIVGEYFSESALDKKMDKKIDEATEEKALTATTRLKELIENNHCLLLYPGEQAKTLEPSFVTSLNTSTNPSLNPSQTSKSDNKKELCLIVLDGTWKKAYRMFMLSPMLQTLTQVTLPESIACAGRYQIRKVAKKNALSSLEACCYALMLLENQGQLEAVLDKNKSKSYQKLLGKFDDFNQFQLGFVPPRISD
ncbi:MAG: tRNA-uridine aminocarboxypropyltransferase [Colwellia sp.]